MGVECFNVLWRSVGGFVGFRILKFVIEVLNAVGCEGFWVLKFDVEFLKWYSYVGLRVLKLRMEILKWCSYLGLTVLKLDVEIPTLDVEILRVFCYEHVGVLKVCCCGF